MPVDGQRPVLPHHLVGSSCWCEDDRSVVEAGAVHGRYAVLAPIRAVRRDRVHSATPGRPRRSRVAQPRGRGPSPFRQLTELADATCAQLSDALVIQLGAILEPAPNEAAALGFGGPRFGDELRKSCPDTMAAVDQIIEDQQLEEELPALVEAELEFDGCFSEGRQLTGAVTNPTDRPISVTIEVDFLLVDGTLVDDSIDFVDLAPGQRGLWEVTRKRRAARNTAWRTSSEARGPTPSPDRCPAPPRSRLARRRP